MGHDLLNETFIRQRSAELQIPFENLLILCEGHTRVFV